jgi:multidrug resistance efflux pump
MGELGMSNSQHVIMPSEPAQELSRSIGFPQSACAHSKPQDIGVRTPASKPTAAAKHLKKRPKGRWFVTVVIGSLIGFVAINLWNELGKYQAYGELQGTVVRVSPVVAGRVHSTSIQEGDCVQAGQLLAKIDVRELRVERRRMNNELQIAISNLEVRLAEVQARTRQIQSDQFDRQIEYYKLLGEYHAKRSQLEELASNFNSNELLRESRSVAEIDYIAAKAAFEGQKAQVNDLADAVKAIEPALKLSTPEDINDLLRVEQSRMAALKMELAEVDQLIEASEIRAPFAGRILKKLCNAGEYVEPHRPVVELLQTDSVESVIYMPQHRANLLEVGDEIRLLVAPLHEAKYFRVHRISPEILPPPQSLQSNYRAFKGTVRVHATPITSSETALGSDLSNWLGAEVALPRFGYRAPRVNEANLELGLLWQPRRGM